MEFYEVIEKRRSIREFQDKPIARDVLERILNAGLKAPSSNHQRQWELLTLTDKEVILSVAKIVKPYYCRIAEPKTPQQEMFKIAYPLQRKMIEEAAVVVLPYFKCKYGVEPGAVGLCGSDGFRRGVGISREPPVGNHSRGVGVRSSFSGQEGAGTDKGTSSGSRRLHAARLGDARLCQRGCIGSPSGSCRRRKQGQMEQMVTIRDIDVESVFAKSNLPVCDYSVNPRMRVVPMPANTDREVIKLEQ